MPEKNIKAEEAEKNSKDNLDNTTEPVLTEDLIKAQAEHSEAVHLEMQPVYTWGYLINKLNAPAQVEYDTENFTLSGRETSQILRKDLIKSISKGSNTQFKPIKG